MTKRPPLTPTARRFSKALLRNYPRFVSRFRVLRNGDFDASIPAPPISRAGALVCQTRGSDVWIRFAPPRAFYSIDSPRGLVSIVGALLNDEVSFVLLSKRRQ
jgi:hypothetical protein